MDNTVPFKGQLAPIVLTVFNRPYHTEQTLKALKANDLANQSKLYIFSDGPKHLALQEDLEKIKQVRQLAKSEQWCKEVYVIESQCNLGQVNSFVKAITEIVNQYGRVIVLEDDQITGKGFLKYMNKALELYKNDVKVMHISAYMYPAKFKCKNSSFFLNIQTCPGWGTWKRAWNHYNHDAIDHLKYFSQSKKQKRKFDIEGNAYFFSQLERNAGPINYSWAVRWYASCSRANGLALFPEKSLIKNIGIDGTGVHCQPTTMYDVEAVDYLEIEKVPIVENLKIRKAVDKFYKKNLKRYHSYSMKNIFKMALKILGAGKIKIFLRWIIKKIFPELNRIEEDYNSWSFISSTSVNSSVSSKAKMYPPYHIYNSTVGDYSYVSKNSWISSTTIGKFCSIGPNLHCGHGIHPVDGISTSPMFYSTLKQNGTTLSPINKVQERKPINIGNDVFIGTNVTILDGISIGDGAVVGAGCLVSKDVPPFAIVVGNPMRILRYRFSEKIRRELSALKWWEIAEAKLPIVERNFFQIEEIINILKLEKKSKRN